MPPDVVPSEVVPLDVDPSEVVPVEVEPPDVVGSLVVPVGSLDEVVGDELDVGVGDDVDDAVGDSVADGLGVGVAVDDAVGVGDGVAVGVAVGGAVACVAVTVAVENVPGWSAATICLICSVYAASWSSIWSSGTCPAAILSSYAPISNQSSSRAAMDSSDSGSSSVMNSCCASA